MGTAFQVQQKILVKVQFKINIDLTSLKHHLKKQMLLVNLFCTMSKRNQTKLELKLRGPFKVIELLEGNRYLLKSLDKNRTYKYARKRLRALPECYVPTEFENIFDNSDNEEQSGSTVVGASDVEIENE